MAESLKTIMTRVFVRTAIGFGLIGAWFLFTPYLFFWFLTSFDFYNTIVANIGTTNDAVYQIMTWIPIMLGTLGTIFWAGGIVDWLADVLDI